MRILRWLKILGVALIVMIGALTGYVAITWDKIWDVPLPSDVQASTDPAVLARGEYLVYGPGHCIECHGSSYDAISKLADGVKVPLSGGLEFGMGPLGTIYEYLHSLQPEEGATGDVEV